MYETFDVFIIEPIVCRVLTDISFKTILLYIENEIQLNNICNSHLLIFLKTVIPNKAYS